MKILKLKSDKLAQTTADIAYKTFIRACSKIDILHNSPETATSYLIVLEQAFKEEKSPMLIIGDLTTTWVKYAKELKKKNAKNVLWGQCFATKTQDETIAIQLINKVGSGKLAALLKFPEIKAILKKAKASIIWAKGMSDDALETEGLEENLETLDEKDEERIENFIGTKSTDETTYDALENFAEDAAIIKRRIDDMGKAVGEIKLKILKELEALILQFLNETENTLITLSEPLIKFRGDVKILYRKWQKQAQKKLVSVFRLQMKTAFLSYKTAK